VIISHKHKFISLDPPKTGTNYRQNLFWDYGYYVKRLQHANLIEVKNFFKSRNVDLHDYFVFTFVRNPWNRYLSYFNWFHRNNGYDRLTHSEFRRFMYNPKYHRDKYLAFPQSYWFEHRNVMNIDFVGAIENFKQDMDFVLSKIGINLTLSDRVENKSDGRLKFHDAYSQDLINFVAKKEERVIELKGYTCP